MGAAEAVDMVVATDYNGRGVVGALYQAAYELYRRPLCGLAAEKIARTRSALFFTGFRSLRFGGVYESDGLVSTCLLASELSLRGVDVAVVVDSGFEEVVRAGLAGYGVGVYGAPIDGCTAFLSEIYISHKPDTAIYVERPGANSRRRYHNMHGEDVTSLHAPLDISIPMLRERGVTVVAFGDGGNEAGMGCIREAVQRSVRYGGLCLCGCGGGIAADVAADVLVVANTSDLGVFGVAALIEPGLLKSMSNRMAAVLKNLMEMGVLDVVKGPGFVGVDGLSLNVYNSVNAALYAVSRSDARKL